VASAQKLESTDLGVPARDAGVVPELVGRALRGDAAAFQEIYRRFAPSVHGVALARCSIQDAEEVVQETFVLAHRSLASLREPSAIGPWLHAIARNAANDRHRARSKLPRSEPLRDDLAAGAKDEENELRARVLHHIRSLPEAYRETLLLRLVEGLSGPEIAEAVGLTAASVRVNLHRGMELLRPLLSKEGWP